ncbi:MULTISPECIES: metalloregulator ArsR/SmtB family transcription factor [Streptosporangium]|jgi:ArsR family transcriptional regulator, lead/cadmium/zinc/bismuth-responsive transcriptional repressor|uniref:DNA-binding transcriptional regulator, ArsR family n=1 Tax=Streptosporangium subroseum TaxID=106412 RepID=A0A239IN62_9ACTN|nr:MULTISPECIES: metalloregulator ArsR/SmtB family transcription factor [Streptosporangium]AWS47571.1 ArsR family transcriptional regulator [Streptosporangium sp. 'caverna']WSA17477.1 metalloregulator ArsR/SmtB family transcription factor [Streptosporangium subroseum]SNS94971.1 DNA-binding transcriptional regulator, ArsR family [Streptosporangium subroseum]
MDVVTGLDACSTMEPDEARVAATRERLVTAGEATRLADLFRLLGDPTRAQLLYALLEAGELCVCDLTETVEVSDTAVSHALRLLRTAGIVASRRAGRMIYYRLADAHVRMLLDLSREHLRHEIVKG